MSFLPLCVLQFEADRRAFIITVNSFGTDLSGADRSALYPSCGKLYPDGLRLLAKAEDHEQVKAVADCYPVSGIASPMVSYSDFKPWLTLTSTVPTGV